MNVTNTPWHLLHCPECPGPEGVVVDNPPNLVLSWCIPLQCPDCHFVWYICSTCIRARSFMTNDRQIADHHRHYHTEGGLPGRGLPQLISRHNYDLDESIESIADATDRCSDQQDEDHTLMSSVEILESLPAYYFSRNESLRYFIEQERGRETTYMVGRSAFGMDSLVEGVDISTEDVHFQILMARMIARLPFNDIELFAEILQRLRRQGAPTNLSSRSNDEFNFSTTEDFSSMQLRRAFLKGRTSFLVNLPYPAVHNLGSHAYINISDILKHIMALGHLPLDFSRSPTNRFPIRELCNTPRADELRQNCDYNESSGSVAFFEWSDDFDPNNCKKNRSSVWIKTVTFIHSTEETGELASFTYPVAIGPKSSDHNEIEQILANDVKKSPLNCFSSRANGMVTVDLCRYACIQDQMERRPNNSLQKGNAHNAPRWGYACNWNEMNKKVIPSCDKCFALLIKYAGEAQWCPRRRIANCRKCANWGMHMSHPALRYPKPPDFPVGYLLNCVVETGRSQSWLMPVKLEYGSLLEVVALCHRKIVSEEWSLTESKTYMTSHTINEETSSFINECADNCRLMDNMMTSDNEADTTTLELLRDQAAAFPDLFEPWKPPALWVRETELHLHFDAPMHLTTLGVSKTSMTMIFQWAKVVGKATAIRTQGRELLKQIQRLKLSWVNIPPGFGGDFGGWLSENYGAMARILPWVYSILPSINNSVDFVEPKKPVQEWVMAETKEWLSIRGLPKTGLAQELKDIVSAWKAKPIAEQPPIKKYLQATTLQVLQFLHAWTRVYSYLMVAEIPDETYYSTLLKRIMIYLSYLEKVDRGFRVDDDSVPRWIRKYSLVCLMNLPDMVHRYGPVRLLWEGGWKGEGYVKLVKTLVTNGYAKNWQSSTLIHLLENMALENIAARIPVGEANIVKSKSLKMYVTYKNISNCVTEIGRTRVLSVVLRNNCMYMVYRTSLDRYLVPVTRVESTTIGAEMNEYLGMYYHKFKLDMEGEEEEEPLSEDETFHDYGIMLPLQDANMSRLQRKQYYTLVTREHDETYFAPFVRD